MLTTRHPVDFAYTRPELEALSRYARAHDVERGGRYDARSAAINVWSHHWLHPATREGSETIGTFYVHWDPPALWQRSYWIPGSYETSSSMSAPSNALPRFRTL
jgi:hypothetical protein